MVALGYGYTTDVELCSSSAFLSHSFSHRIMFFLSASTTSPLAAPAPLGPLLYAEHSCTRPINASYSQVSRGAVSLPISLIPQSTDRRAATLEALKWAAPASGGGATWRSYRASGALPTQYIAYAQRWGQPCPKITLAADFSTQSSSACTTRSAATYCLRRSEGRRSVRLDLRADDRP